MVASLTLAMLLRPKLEMRLSKLDIFNEPVKRDGRSMAVLEWQCAIESTTEGLVLPCLR